MTNEIHNARIHSRLTNALRELMQERIIRPDSSGTDRTIEEFSGKISAHQLSIETGVDKMHILGILRGKRAPSLAIAERIAEGLGYSMKFNKLKRKATK